MNIGVRERLTRQQVAEIQTVLGTVAILFDLHLTDFSRGAMRVGPRSKCFWLTDGRRITLQHMPADDSIVASITPQPDLGRPKPLQLH